ncbi:MAG: cupredoxin domain-containing protein, partial [Nitrosotalea sp.]
NLMFPKINKKIGRGIKQTISLNNDPNNSTVLTCNFYSIYMKNKTNFITSVIFVTILFVIGSNQAAFAENKTVTIPLGAANPNFDTPTTEWFSPSVVTVQAGDTITWINKDKEIHNITSGKGITRIQFATTNNVGTSDGLFESGSFKPGQSWSHTFTKPGVYHYFCSIHPWMNGAIVVNQQVPTVATDASGQLITKWPVVEKTLDGQYEVDLSWEPHVILTNEKTSLVYQIYNGITGRMIESGVTYKLVIIQNGNELFRTDGATQIGGDYKYFVFKDPGSATFRFQNVGGRSSFVDFSTLVYQNPNATNTQTPIIQPARNIILGQEMVIIFVAPSIAVFLVVILYTLGVFSKKSRNKEEKHEQKRTPI